MTNKISERIGWHTNERSKSYAIDALSCDLDDAKCIPHSAKTFAELRTFVHGERGKMAALPGKHDDRTMALGLVNIASREGRMGEIIRRKRYIGGKGDRYERSCCDAYRRKTCCA